MGDSAQRRRPPLRVDREKPENTEKMDKFDKFEKEAGFEASYEDSDTYNTLDILFENVSLQDNDRLSESLDYIINYFENDVKSSVNKREVLLNTFFKCLVDREFAIKAGALYGLIHSMKIGEETFRTVLLSTIQKELEDNNFVKGDRPRFLNAVFLLSELYYHIRFDGNPISILGAELLKYFRWLLTGAEEELEVLAIGFIVNGSTLKKDKPASYRKIIMDIRIALVTRNLSSLSRCWLLLILDHDSLNFGVLPEELLLCHMTLIGDQEIQKLRRFRPTAVMHSSSDNNSNSRQFTSDRRHSPDRRTSPNRQRSFDLVQPSDKWRSSERRRSPRRRSPEKRRSPDRRLSPDKPRSPERRRSPDRRCSTDQNQSPERWDSPERQPSPDRRHSDSSKQHLSEANRPQMKTTQRWSINDHTNRQPKAEGRGQQNQSLQGNANQKSNYGRWSADPPNSGAAGHKTERRIPVWQHEHDDRFDRDYAN